MMLTLALTNVATAAAAGACMDATDQGKWTAKGQAAFDTDMQTCGKKCLGRSSCVKTCIEGAEGYSDACSSCFGDLAGCTASKCWTKCIGGETDSCKACVKASCDAPFTSCSGLTPPSTTAFIQMLMETAPMAEAAVEAAAAGACMDATDQGKWTAKGQAAFDTDMQTCGKKCLGRSSCVKTCIEGAEGYSDACSSCFGDLAGCTASKCWTKCIGGETDSCKACVKASCDAPFTSCSGLTPPSTTAFIQMLGSASMSVQQKLEMLEA